MDSTVPTRRAGRRTRTRHAISVAAAALTGLTLAAACSSGSSSGGGTGGTGTKDFTFWSMWTQSEPVAKVLQQAITSFEHDTGVTVHVQWEGRDSLTKVKAALNTSKVPDLIDQGFPGIDATLGNSNAALDLSQVYQMPVPGEAGKTVRSVVPTSYDALDSSNGKLIIAPYYISADTWWYNANAYPQFASKPPATWSELAQDLSAVKAKGQNPLAQDADILNYNATLVYAALERTLGPGNVLKLAADHSGKGWDDPKVNQAIEAIASLAKGSDYIPGYDASKYPTMEKDWAHGKAALLFMGSWVPYYDGPDAGKNFKLGTFPFPSIAGTDTAVPTTTFGFSIPKKAKNGPAAEKFISYVLGKKWMTLMSSQAEILTPRTDIQVPAALSDLQKVLNNNPHYAEHDNVDAKYPNLDQRFEPLFQGLITGKLDAAKFIAQAKAAQVQYWKLDG